MMELLLIRRQVAAFTHANHRFHTSISRLLFPDQLRFTHPSLLSSLPPSFTPLLPPSLPLSCDAVILLLSPTLLTLHLLSARRARRGCTRRPRSPIMFHN